MGIGNPAGGDSDRNLLEERGGSGASDITRSGGSSVAVSQPPTAAATPTLSTGESKQSLPSQQGPGLVLEGNPDSIGTIPA